MGVSRWGKIQIRVKNDEEFALRGYREMSANINSKEKNVTMLGSLS